MKSFTVRLDEELLHKFHIVADYEGRSANGEAVFLMRRIVEQFEEKNGKIELSNKN